MPRRMWADTISKKLGLHLLTGTADASAAEADAVANPFTGAQESRARGSSQLFWLQMLVGGLLGLLLTVVAVYR